MSEDINIKLSGNLRIDLSDFERLSRDVGYYNCLSNQKGDDDRISYEYASKYEELRDKQLIMLQEIIKHYTS